MWEYIGVDRKENCVKLNREPGDKSNLCVLCTDLDRGGIKRKGKNS